MRSPIITGVMALAIVCALFFGLRFMTRGPVVSAKGQILKVRTYPVDPQNTITVIDFRLSNSGEAMYQVADVSAYVDGTDGSQSEGANFADSDAQRVFDYYKVLGPKYNPTLVSRERIKPGETVDRMIAVNFSLPESKVINRKDLRLEIKEADGTTTHMVKTGP